MWGIVYRCLAVQSHRFNKLKNSTLSLFYIDSILELSGDKGGFMHSQLQNILSDIENRLNKEDVIRFKIGITYETVGDRFKNGYDDDGYTHISEIAYGDVADVKQAEKDLIQWALNNTKIKDKCENEANGGGDIDDAYYVYIVAESTTVSENKQERLLEDLPKSLFEESILVNLK